MRAAHVREKLDQAPTDLATEARLGHRMGIKNVVARVEVPRCAFVHESALWEADPVTGTPMRPDHQFHVASVTKTMTATSILRMWEGELLGASRLDATLGDLGTFDRMTLERLHVRDGGSYGRKITVRQLPTHTSGIEYAAVDDADRTAADYGGPAPGSYNR